MMRLFIGIAIPVGVRSQIALLTREMKKYAPGKYVSEDMYHITLAYIGESDDEMRCKAQECAKACAGEFMPCALVPGKPGYFGNRSNSILYLNVDGGEALQPVSSVLRRLLTASGLPYDPKPLNPHITLARHVNAVDRLFEANVNVPGFNAEGVTLFNSCRIDGVLRYVPLFFAPFHKQR